VLDFIFHYLQQCVVIEKNRACYPQKLLQYVWFVQDRLSHRLYWLHDWDCGLVVWVCTADHLEDEEASGGGQRHDTTTWAAFWEVAQWCGGNIQ
jgi:hypothetical protein